MRARLEAEGRLRIDFQGVAERRAFAERLAKRGDFLVLLARPLEPGSRCRVRLVAENGSQAALDAEATRIVDSASADIGVAFKALDRSAERAAEIDRWAGLETGPAPAAAAPGATSAPVAEDAEDADEGETRGVSVIHRLRELDVNRRSILAMKAGRSERAILVRDSSPQVLQALLANPRLEAKELLQLVKSNHATAAILQRVAGDARWNRNAELLTALARNHRTPSPVAVRLIEKLRTSDLRLMAKMSSGLRENVRRAALREYLKRSGRG